MLYRSGIDDDLREISYTYLDITYSHARATHKNPPEPSLFLLTLSVLQLATYLDVASRQHFKVPFPECSSFLLTPSLQHTTSGDIGVFKDMPITHLDLGQCEKLTGEWVRIT